MKAARITHIVTDLEIGGAEIMLTNLLSAMTITLFGLPSNTRSITSRSRGVSRPIRSLTLDSSASLPRWR